MITRRSSVLLWTPRVLAVLLALFLSLFALDAFDLGYGFWKSVAAFLIHLVPVYVVLFALLIAWRHPRVGALFFLSLAVAYVLLTRDRFSILTQAAIAGPLALVGILFLLSGFARNTMTG